VHIYPNDPSVSRAEKRLLTYKNPFFPIFSYDILTPPPQFN
jgi:hypothetical protein